MATIKSKRGLEANLENITLLDGEFAVTMDTHKLYVGIAGVKYCIGSASALGDMLKSIYDTDNDGVVDNAENSDKLDGKHASDFALLSHTHTNIVHNDTRSVNFAPTTYDGISIHLKTNGVDGLTDGGTYHGIMHIQQWSDISGGQTHQLAFTDNGNMYFRTSISATTWGTWRKLWHDGNFDPNTKANNTDDTRTTTAKDVTGAINELNAKIIALENIINNNNFIIT